MQSTIIITLHSRMKEKKQLKIITYDENTRDVTSFLSEIMRVNASVWVQIHLFHIIITDGLVYHLLELPNKYVNCEGMLIKIKSARYSRFYRKAKFKILTIYIDILSFYRS